jgi:hypothetical protein
VTSPRYSITYSAVLSGTAGSGLAGDVLIPDSDGLYIKATTANRAGRRSTGVALFDYQASNSVEVQQLGMLSAALSGLGVGAVSWVRVSALGRLERCTPSAGDDIIGKASADGSVHLMPGVWDEANTLGGGSTTVADDIAKSAGADIDRVKGLNAIPIVTEAGVALADGVAPLPGGSMVYNENAGTPGFRAKKPVMPGWYNIDDYGGGQNWVNQTNTNDGTANLAAINAIIALESDGAGTTSSGSVKNRAIRILIDGYYYFSDTIHFNRTVLLEGTSGTFSVPHSPGTQLVFPANCDGLHFYATSSTMPPGLLNTPGAERSQVRNLTIRCKDRGALVSRIPVNTGDGISFSVPMVIENVTVDNFAGSGFKNHAENPANLPTADAGNTSGSRLVKCTADGCGMHGFITRGNDTSGSCFDTCSAVINNGWGFVEGSLGGCTYIACHGEGNTGESAEWPSEGYHVDGKNHDYKVIQYGTNETLFIGCYTEVAVNDIDYPAGCIGGLLAEGSLYADNNGFSLSSGGLMAQGGLAYYSSHATNGMRTEIGNYTDETQALALIVQTSRVNTDFTWLRHNATSRWNEFQHNSAANVSLQLPTSLANPRQYAPWMTNGMFFGPAASTIHFQAAPSVPSLQVNSYPATYEIGDTVWNTDPSVPTLCWRCTVAGTMGTLNGGATTGTITTATTALALSSQTSVLVGQYLTIAGVSGVKKVTALTASAAVIECANAEPYALANGMILSIKVDGGAVQDLVINSAYYANVAAATAEEVGVQLYSYSVAAGMQFPVTSGGTKVSCRSSSTGLSSSIEVTGGTANAVLGFSTSPVTGTVGVTIGVAADATVAGAAVAFYNPTHVAAP